MSQFSKRNQRPESLPSAGEFRAPAGPARLRGSSAGARDPKPTPPAPPPPGAAMVAGSRSGPARDELKLCGLAAVRARFARDPGSIQRLFFDYATGRSIGVMCKVLAQSKKVYRCVEPAELEKIAGSIHHGGIVAVVAPPVVREPGAADVQSWAKRGEPVLVLDRVGNAHNLGAIARTAAYFGVPRIVIPAEGGAARPTDAAHRVAEGGFEHLEVWQTHSLLEFVRQLATAGYDVIGAATRGGRPAARATTARPVALVLGNEELGLAPEVAAACGRLATIPGQGKIDSLNVSVAAGVLMWELIGRPGR